MLAAALVASALGPGSAAAVDVATPTATLLLPDVTLAPVVPLPVPLPVIAPPPVAASTVTPLWLWPSCECRAGSLRVLLLT